MTETDTPQAAPTYRIGAVSRLTGVAPDTLRVWERRYGAVVPTRTPKGSRLYSHEDIGRLALIKRLVDGGDAISRVANLTQEELDERAKGTRATGLQAESGQDCRIAVLGSTLPEKMGNEPPVKGQIELVGLYQDRDELLAKAAELDIDVIVLEYATIQPEQIREIGLLLLRSNAARAVVVYGFASRATLERLESARIIPIRGPIDPSELYRWCLMLNARPEQVSGLLSEAGVDISRPLPPRRFDEVTLAKIAAASVTLRCECPHHLVDLISSLSAFETYSEECEVLNIDDAALHAFLHSAAAQSRSLLEAALSRVMDADGIEIEP